MTLNDTDSMSPLSASGEDTPDSHVLHSLAELYGIGKGLWEGVDAQEFVNALRDEWDEREA